ncbi:hypothetical protein J4402_02105 [Candidatus Pacearchaeota archaeon]|nr:hypothetical protein [uncultured archaeon]AQS31854.1 hypothetical protein [uncultured archaeon]MBS3088551.1 hypothetical protein [Candidatus Pacearchaeota archaeon]
MAADEDIKKVDLRNFLFSHGELSKYDEIGSGTEVNDASFLVRLNSGGFKRYYAGSGVAFHKGVFCGQADSPSRLLEEAQRYYGESNLDVYRLPQADRKLEIIGEVAEFRVSSGKD